ncbi:hypothetical protein [Amphibacillus indicireducens]
MGWRGLIHPEQEKKLPPILSALIIGVVWSFWHLPFLLSGLININS